MSSYNWYAHIAVFIPKEYSYADHNSTWGSQMDAPELKNYFATYLIIETQDILTLVHYGSANAQVISSCEMVFKLTPDTYAKNCNELPTI